ncbi:GspH/FimT family pseudopilin [Thiobaca trueperi]|uniref:Type II secretion system protein H n=1 Tax=Thiobaca trueperi TaxID=127458 RepID=A0A4R3MSB2_9GAMM|nr:GspH/FimT family pseudopilin [Thiobaca trueperi]TCT18845.1 type IV fimbrial biogenesis protein FimT [Thiobaca trueperi]
MLVNLTQVGLSARHRLQNAGGGFTLLELLIAVSVLTILLAIAIPSMQALLTRNHLKAAAQALAEDLQWTRSESIARNQMLRVVFNMNHWCYGIDENASATAHCDCRLSPGETSACSLKQVSGAAFPGIGLTGTFSATRFEPRRATAINGSLNLTAANGPALRVVLSRLGRVRICAPTGSVAGYEPCGG